MRRHFFVRAILALAAIGLLAAGMRGAFRTGWWQGYQAGQAAEPEDGAAPYWGPRAMPFGPGHMWPRTYGFRPFGLLRSLLTVLLLLFLFSLAAKAFGFWAWRKAWKGSGKDGPRAWPHGHWPHGRPPHGPWSACAPRGHPHWPHGPMPPWFWGDAETGETEPTEEQVAKVKPDAEKSGNES